MQLEDTFFVLVLWLAQLSGVEATCVGCILTTAALVSVRS